MNLSRRSFLALSATALAGGLVACATGSDDPGPDGAPSTVPPAPLRPPAERTVAFGFEDVAAPDTDWRHYRDLLEKADATDVTLAVGRPDWLAFPWEGHEEWESAAVSGSGRDFVAEALSALPGLGVTLVVDALAPRAIDRDPEMAGVTARGRYSTDFPSVSALDGGEYGQRLVAMCAEIAQRYRPRRIELTELMFDDATFGENDLEHFRRTTGLPDFPTTSRGDISVNAPAVRRWRSESLGRVLARVSEAVSPYGVTVDMDVRAPWEDAHGDRAESGHDYDIILENSDRLVVWNYYGLQDVEPEYSGELTTELRRRYDERFVLSFGLWRSRDRVLSPAELEEGLRAAIIAGVPAVSVTPASYMTDEHWAVLAKIASDWL